MRNRLALYALVLLLPLGSLSAATPPSGDVSSTKTAVTWSGAPLASNPVACLSSTDPGCDHFILTITGGGIKNVAIAVKADAGFEGDDYDLFVYDDQGVLVGQSATSSSAESVVIANSGAPYYEVRVQPYLVTPGSTYTGVAEATREQAVDVNTNDCLEVVPSDVSVPVLDSGQRVELSVMLLLDSTDAEVAEQIMARAAESYRPHGIDLVLKKLRTVSYSSLVSEELIKNAKDTVGGVPPKGIDLVGVFTNKQMQAIAGGATVVGQADCIGGIRWDENSFFVVSDIRAIENPSTGTTGTLNSLGLNPNVDATAEVMAHEIGHLMGAHHHYANCIEGNLQSGGANDLSPCTLMFNAVNFSSLYFGGVSGSVVRGHAVNHASQND